MPGPNEILLKLLLDLVELKTGSEDAKKTIDDLVAHADKAFKDAVEDPLVGPEQVEVLEKLRAQFKLLGEQQKKIHDGAQKELRETIGLQQKVGSEAGKAGQAQAESARRNQKQLNALRNALATVVERYKQLSQTPGFKKSSAEAQKLSLEVERLAKHLSNASSRASDIKKVNSAFKLVGVTVKEVRNNLALLVERYKQLQAQPGFDRSSKEAKKLAEEIKKAANALKQYSTDVRSVRQANAAIKVTQTTVKELVNALELATRKVNQLKAAGVGVNSPEYKKAVAEVRRLGTEIQKTSGKASDLKKVDAAMLRIQKETKGLRASFGKLNRTLASFGVILGGVSLIRFAKSAVDARIAMERIEQSLIAATGSSEKAGVAFDFLDSTVAELGLNLRDSATGFSQLAAAAKGTSLEGAQLEHIFRSTAIAGRVLNLSAEQIKGTITALRQTIGKARVSAEELRRQLGDRIPGAFELAARAMGVSTQELDKMMERGELLAVDLLPKLADQMQETFGPGLQKALNSTAAKIGRLQTEIFKFQAAFGEGLAEGLGESLEAAGKGFAGLRSEARETGNFLGQIAIKAGDAANFLERAGIGAANLGAELDLLAAKKFGNADDIREAEIAIDALQIRYDELINSAAAAEAEQRRLADSARATATAVYDQIVALEGLEGVPVERLLALAQASAQAQQEIRKLGDTAGEDIKRLKEDLEGVTDALKDTPEFLIGLIDGINESVQSLASGADITAKEAQSILAAIEEVFVRFNKLPEEQRKALQGSVDALRVWKLEALEQLEGFDEVLGDLGGKTSEQIEKMVGSLSRYLEEIGETGDVTQQQADIIVEAYEEIKEEIAKLPVGQQKALNELVGQLGDVEGQYAKFTEDFKKDSEEAAKDSLEAWEGFGDGLLKLFDVIAEESAGVGQEIADSLAPDSSTDTGKSLEDLGKGLEELRAEKELLQNTPILTLDEVNRMDELNKLIGDQRELLKEAGPVGFGPTEKDAKTLAKIQKQSEKYRKTVRKMVTENEDFRETFEGAGESAQNEIQRIIENYDSLIATTGGSQSAAEEYGRAMADVFRGIEGAPEKLIREFDRLGKGAQDLGGLFEDLKNAGKSGGLGTLSEEAKETATEMEKTARKAEELEEQFKRFETESVKSVSAVNAKLSEMMTALSSALSTCKELVKCMQEIGT